MQVLKKILGEASLETFLERHFTKLPFSCPHGANAYVHLLDWKVVESVIAAKKSVIRIVRDGKMIKDHAQLNFNQAKTHYEKGHTLLLRFADKGYGPLNELAQGFSNSFHTKVDIQLYCTPEGHNAFGWHYDVEEVFIFQTKGSKSYSIRPNTVHPNPLVASIPKDLEYEKENTPIEIHVTLEAGDWLYIPSGWWHVAQTRSESMHISLGLMPSSAWDAVSYLPSFLAKDPFWRTRMPVHKSFENADEEILFYQTAMLTLGKDLTKHFSSIDFIRAFLADKKIKTDRS